jgi:heat shock protein HslJ
VPLRLLAPLLIAVAVSGCRTASPPPAPLAGTTWTLTSLEERGAPRAGLPPDQLTFDADGRGVRLRSCNQCSGLYTLGDRTLEVSRLGCTRMACPNDRLQLDRYVAGRSRWLLQGDALVLDVDDPINGIEATLTFRRAATADTTGR